MAIKYVMQAYPSVSLRHRLAILVPDQDFLKCFTDQLQQALNKIASRTFELVSFDNSVCYLPSSRHRSDRETLVLDSIYAAQGLEQMVVICVGLDCAIETGAVVTRARLYQGITRANFLAIVVNHFEPRGWLAWLQRLKFVPKKLEDTSKHRRLQRQATAEIIGQEMQKSKSKRSQKARESIPESGGLIKQTEATSEKVPELQPLETVHVLGNSVWDVSGNVKEQPRELVFDPTKNFLAWSLVLNKIRHDKALIIPSCPLSIGHCLPSDSKCCAHFFLEARVMCVPQDWLAAMDTSSVDTR